MRCKICGGIVIYPGITYWCQSCRTLFLPDIPIKRAKQLLRDFEKGKYKDDLHLLKTKSGSVMI